VTNRTFTVRQVQHALNRHGFRLAEDGVMGPATEAAISEFKGRNGLLRRPVIGPLTLELLFGKGLPPSWEPDADPVYPPWLNELGRHMGLHEKRDNEELRAWLRSDGATLGDPAKLPWCGDAIQTAIRLTLPEEPFPGDLGRNPYWARNWALLGEESPLRLGVIAAMVRDGGGHVAAVVGYDPRLRRLRVRGGNQSNSINDTWIDEARVIGLRAPGRATGYRVPATWGRELPPVPIMDAEGQVISQNEA
jgi:hypothetical protein